MVSFHLKVITPRKVVIDDTFSSITVPSEQGELTILPHHSHLLSVLREGIIMTKKDDKEDFLAIGGGYLETNGKEVNILVSRAYGQDEIDREVTERAVTDAKKVLQEVKDEKSRIEAEAVIRRSVIDSKLIKRKRHNVFV